MIKENPNIISKEQIAHDLTMVYMQNRYGIDVSGNISIGLVVSRQEGKWIHYRLDEAGREEAAKLLLALTTPQKEQEGGCPVCGR